jgi:hypothetical protein
MQNRNICTQVHMYSFEVHMDSPITTKFLISTNHGVFYIHSGIVSTYVCTY